MNNISKKNNRNNITLNFLNTIKVAEPRELPMIREGNVITK